MNIEMRLSDRVVAALQEVVGVGPVQLHTPTFNGNETKYLQECIESTFVSSVGQFVGRFEADLASYTGSKFVVAVVNGTSALHVALQLAGVGANEEVLIPALTFIATANAVTYCGAIPHFVDSESTSLGIDAVQLREYLKAHTEQISGLCVNRTTQRVIRAIVPMHTFGHPSDIDALLAVATDFNLVLVEDAAESLGSFLNDQHTGTFGLLGTLSFNGNKTITTGGGGAILTNNEALARRAKHLTTTAKVPHAWEFVHDEIGYNYRMPNINAALGCAQLERLPEMLRAKRNLYESYEKAFGSISDVELMSEPSGARSNYWLQTLVIKSSQAHLRDEILEVTNSAGFMTRPAWTLLADLKPYANCPSMELVTARDLVRRIVNIPSSAHLGISHE
jgi:aminotransferase in exopolysaccharide biosynthesis